MNTTNTDGVLPTTDDEIDAAIRDFEMAVTAGEYRDVPRSRVRAMMRRALRYVPEGATPAPSALREAVESGIDALRRATNRIRGQPGMHLSVAQEADWAIDRMEQALAAAPEGASAGVVVPEDVREWARRTVEATGDNDCQYPSVDSDIATAKWILSLPEAPQPYGKCWTCHGTGFIDTSAQQVPGGPTVFGYSRSTCSRCGGTGKLPAAPQPPERSAAQARCEVRPGLERTCELGTLDCQVLHIPVHGSKTQLAHSFTSAISSLQRHIKRMGEERCGTFDEAALDAMLEVQSALEWLRALLARLGGEGQGGQA